MQQQTIRFEVHPATKQTKESVQKALRSATETSKRTGKCTVMLRVMYGDCTGPAVFTFKDGIAKSIKPYRGYSIPKDIIFAVAS